MSRFVFRHAISASVLVLLLSLTHCGFAQMVGSRGGVFGADLDSTLQSEMTPELAQSVVIVEGSAVESVKPSQIRIILALTFEGMSSRECKTGVEEKIAQLRPLWKQAGLADDKIVEDFISILPRYEIEFKKQDDREMAMEKKSGYIMQTNIHLAVADDAEAMKALEIAFANGVTDIIGFDYWSDELDQKKKDVRAKAIQAAKEKSELLLGLFENKPPVINVQENTTVVYPESMYASFQNSLSSEYHANYNSRRNIPLIKLPRPQNTYYRGNLPNADVHATGLPMRPALSVVSTVKIFYQSPAAEKYNAGQKND